ncbi:MAG TPA: GAF domain-containing protein [Anaerolineales bacterium]|nr:GAF domain-containing protein [Anaerolineales bacterium]
MAEIKTQTLGSYLRLIEISRDLASTLDLDILLDDIVRASADITHAEAASILLYDDTARQLYFQVATNIDDATMRGLVVPLDKSIAGWIVLNRKSLRIDDAEKDERIFSEVDQTIGYSTKSLLGIPLVTKNKVVGVLEVVNKKRGKFTDADESMLSVLGAQAAVAIENARLFQQSDLIQEIVLGLVGGERVLGHSGVPPSPIIGPYVGRHSRASHAAGFVKHRHIPPVAPRDVARTTRPDRQQHSQRNLAAQFACLLLPRPRAIRIGARAIPQDAFQRGRPALRSARCDDDQGAGNEHSDPRGCSQ